MASTVSVADTVHNEHVKLTATYLNGSAIAILAIGGFAPIVALVSGASAIQPLTSLLLAVMCLTISGSLHYIGRQLLGRPR